MEASGKITEASDEITEASGGITEASSRAEASRASRRDHVSLRGNASYS